MPRRAWESSPAVSGSVAPPTIASPVVVRSSSADHAPSPAEDAEFGTICHAPSAEALTRIARTSQGIVEVRRSWGAEAMSGGGTGVRPKYPGIDCGTGLDCGRILSEFANNVKWWARPVGSGQFLPGANGLWVAVALARSVRRVIGWPRPGAAPAVLPHPVGDVGTPFLATSTRSLSPSARGRYTAGCGRTAAPPRSSG